MNTVDLIVRDIAELAPADVGDNDTLTVSVSDLEVILNRHILEKYHKAIAVYCREELGNMSFEDDDECVEYILSFSEGA